MSLSFILSKNLTKLFVIFIIMATLFAYGCNNGLQEPDGSVYEPDQTVEIAGETPSIGDIAQAGHNLGQDEIDEMDIEPNGEGLLSENENGQESGHDNEPENNHATFDDDENNGALIDGFVFTLGPIDIYLGETTDRVLDELGYWRDFYEYASCAFDGDAKMYVYDGFEIATFLYPGDDRDRVYSIAFFDDGVSTSGGIHIGHTYEDMVGAYGDGYTTIPGSYMYEKEGTVLSFSIEDGVIISILYYVDEVFI